VIATADGMRELNKHRKRRADYFSFYSRSTLLGNKKHAHAPMFGPVGSSIICSSFGHFLHWFLFFLSCVLPLFISFTGPVSVKTFGFYLSFFYIYSSRVDPSSLSC
jgi:hypothetical protein